MDSVRLAEVVWTNDGDSYQWVEVAASGFLGQTGYTGSSGGSGSGGASVIVSDTAPVNPVVGNIWFDSTNFNTYIYYNDGVSSQWVEVAALRYSDLVGYTGSAGPAGGYTGSIGIQGYTGSIGPANGYTGSASTTIGYTGSQGPAGGYTGSAGPANGYAGSVGYTGSQGPAGGYTGSASTVIGYTGSQGPAGGYTGSSGIQGYTGSSSGGGASVTVSATQPVSTVDGSLWLDSDELKLSAYLGGSWVDVNGSTGYTGSIGQTGSSIQMTWQVISSSSTVAVNYGYFVDTTGAAVTLTLPASAVIGNTIRFNDLAGNFAVNSLTIARNGHKIQGVADDLAVSDKQASFGLVYSNATYGWKILEV